MILFNYLAAMGRNSGLCAGMCVSVVWNLLESADSMEKPLNHFFYNRFLARSLVKKVERYQTHIVSLCMKNVGLCNDQW